VRAGARDAGGNGFNWHGEPGQRFDIQGRQLSREKCHSGWLVNDAAACDAHLLDYERGVAGKQRCRGACGPEHRIFKRVDCVNVALEIANLLKAKSSHDCDMMKTIRFAYLVAD
jgi:hypothetical protein